MKRKEQTWGSRGSCQQPEDLTPELDTTGNVTYCNLDEVPTELESESEAGVSENSALTQGDLVCLYGKLEMVCMDCELNYKRNGTRKQSDSKNEDSSETEDSASRDDSSECEYSSYFIHS